MDWPKLLNEIKHRLFHAYFRLARPMTLGVRAAVFDSQGRVLLVRHTYVPGWHLPGGGVEAGETLLEALSKELREEALIAYRGEPALHGMFYNPRYSRRDHVAVYVVREFESLGEWRPDREIVEIGFFPLTALPAVVTQATRTRLAEITGEQPVSARW
jgi:ADP-ribose pyrophosphatase YjhB (NUDIX family)